MITIRNLTMKYGGRPVIDGLNLDLETYLHQSQKRNFDKSFLLS